MMKNKKTKLTWFFHSMRGFASYDHYSMSCFDEGEKISAVPDLLILQQNNFKNELSYKPKQDCTCHVKHA